jgi:hypothetical protein
MSPGERAWQVMHALDVAHTLNGPASDPCFREREPVTRTLIGERPEPEAVILWGVAAGVLHHLAFRWIESRDWPDGVKIALRAVDLGYKGVVLGRNHEAGVRPWGDNEPCRHPPFRMPDARPVM